MSDNAKYYFHIKELAQAIGRHPSYVSNMITGGFQFPATVEEAAKFIRDNPFPTRFRKSYRKSHKSA